ncbi:glutamate--cysteine ligase [Iamia sp. SCSIO 61187]|uniref:glutamate--cysteine ligase n=1 Tax=Iamia sp. SCSIO 61187 TaxID=2722752 RepID=UPI001C6377F2|nr:glutamate--cysteine ligase [Iamia sp. SCSIO 61187]QYG93397.1 glutamate--cysteine ligase [Iamia sp. SCSIO 61187]
MDIDFNSSPGPSLGIEVELEVVDRATGQLASAATEMLAEIGAPHPDGEHPKAKHELFECTVEIITGVCTTVDEARHDLQATLDEVAEAADRRGLDLMCSGTHPFSLWDDQEVSPNPRYARLIQEMQWMARRLQIFGVHVHVGIRSPEKAIAIANALAGYIPHFLALSASSPFWEGRDTGLASSRSKIFEGLPTAGLPAPIESWDDFEQFMETLVSSQAISTVREVWWDIRPHPDFGTVELRMCDGIPTLAEVTAVAALAQCLVSHLDTMVDRGFTLPRHKDWVLRQNKWRAGRYGLDADVIIDDRGTQQPVRSAIGDLLSEMAPVAARLGCEAELARVDGILSGGASYERQRAVVPEGAVGAEALRPVVDLLVGELASDRPGVLLSSP